MASYMEEKAKEKQAPKTERRKKNAGRHYICGSFIATMVLGRDDKEKKAVKQKKIHDSTATFAMAPTEKKRKVKQKRKICARN